MYLGVVGETKRTVLAKILADYYKTASLLYDFNLIDSKLIESHETPEILNINGKQPTPRELYEVNALVDTMINIQRFSQKTRKADSQIKIRATFNILDIVLYGVNHGNKYYRKIFKEYPAVESIYYAILETREDLFELDDVSDVINIKERIQNITNKIDEDNFDYFIQDFDILRTSTLAKRIEDKLLHEIDDEEMVFSDMEYCGIVDAKKSLLFMLSYIEKSGSTNGTLSSFSHYIYIIKYFDDIKRKSKNSLLNAIEINNRAILEKLFYLKPASKRLDTFLESIARDDLVRDIQTQGNEILTIISKNGDALSEDSNDSIFAIFMILEIQQKINSMKEEIKSEMRAILDKNIPFEYRLTELELYVKMLISKMLDNKKVVSNSDEILDGFYKGVSRSFSDLINEVFDEYQDEQEGNNKEDEDDE